MKKRDYPPEKIVEIKLNLRVKHIDKIYDEARRTNKTASQVVRECIELTRFAEERQ